MKEELQIGDHQWGMETEFSNESLWTPPVSNQQLNEWWEKSTYSLNSIFKHVYYYEGEKGGEYLTIFSDDPKLNNKSHSNVAKFFEINSPVYGRCAILTFIRPVQNIADYIKVTLKYPEEMNIVKVFAFEKGLERFGITRDYWIGHFKLFNMKKDESYNLGIVKKTRELDPETANCLPDYTTDDWTMCLVEHTIALGKQKDIIQGCNMCYWPTIKYILNSSETDNVCRTTENLKCTFGVSTRALLRANSQRDCAVSCRVDEYSYHDRSTPYAIEGEGFSKFFMYFNQIEVEFSREHRLYDLNNIVAAVGGSMGLFLGFSFFETVLKVINMLSQKGYFKTNCPTKKITSNDTLMKNRVFAPSEIVVVSNKMNSKVNRSFNQ